MKFQPLFNDNELAKRLRELRGDSCIAPDVSIVIPVNAQGDLENVLNVISDLAHYEGSNRLEFVLVVNNYPPASPPDAIHRFLKLGIRALGIPDVRSPGYAIVLSARMPGIRAAESEAIVMFDSDCRIPHPTELINWYVDQFRNGAGVVYSAVCHYDVAPAFSVYVRLAIHHGSRWVKRSLLGIPTTRGSNYGIRRTPMLEMFERKLLADDLNIGPVFKAEGHKVVYSGNACLDVYTSGRMFEPGWGHMIPYFWYRFKYNLRTLPVRPDVALRTGREKDGVRRYHDNRPVH